MCNSTIRESHGIGLGALTQIDGRPVLQPASNRVVTVQAAARPPMKSILPTLSPTSPVRPLSAASHTHISAAATDHSDIPIIDTGAGPAPLSTVAGAIRPESRTTTTSISSAFPKLEVGDACSKSMHERSDDDANGHNASSSVQPPLPKSLSQKSALSVAAPRKKSENSGQASPSAAHSGGSPAFSLLLTKDEALTSAEPGRIAAAQREQAMLRQAQRKMRVAHYGRAPGKMSTAGTLIKLSPSSAAVEEERTCSFITSNSEPIYVAYHDKEWGVPVHDDKMLFELLVLAGAQVGFDWTTILTKRDGFRAAFAGFDAEEVAKFSERAIAAVSSEYGIDVGRVRSVVENANRILEVKEEFSSLDEYFWGFVNHRPISTRYSSCRKIPSKTSKSEAISRDMVRRGFRFAGPTVVHCFMQAAGLTNNHLLSCPRRRELMQQLTLVTWPPRRASSDVAGALLIHQDHRCRLQPPYPMSGRLSTASLAPSTGERRSMKQERAKNDYKV